MNQPVAYLMENEEAKWLGWEPDPQADWVTPLYKEKWKIAKDCTKVDRAFAEVAPSGMVVMLEATPTNGELLDEKDRQITKLEEQIAELKSRLHSLSLDWQVKYEKIAKLKQESELLGRRKAGS